MREQDWREVCTASTVANFNFNGWGFIASLSCYAPTMPPHYLLIMPPSILATDEDTTRQLPMRERKKAGDASRCPCWSCARRSGCVSECTSFRLYLRTGKDE
jgi:hypothetical protein